MLSMSAILTVLRLRNSNTRSARPMAASAAATVRMKNTNTCPETSPRKRENATKFMFTASSINSSDISSTITFLRSEEHTSELQSLMRISYAVFCLKKKNNKENKKITRYISNNHKHTHT